MKGHKMSAIQWMIMDSAVLVIPLGKCRIKAFVQRLLIIITWCFKGPIL